LILQLLKFKRRTFGKEQRTLSDSKTLFENGDQPISPLNAGLSPSKVGSTSSEQPDSSSSRLDGDTYTLSSSHNSDGISSKDGQFEPTLGQSRGTKKTSADPLGLNAVSLPPTPLVDIIFIHGLGGSSLRTWSWNHDTRHLWLHWLADEPTLSSARVWAYGYSGGVDGFSNALNIHDFAKDLLFKLKMESARSVSIGTVRLS
jgi:hypothetical protein